MFLDSIVWLILLSCLFFRIFLDGSSMRTHLTRPWAAHRSTSSSIFSGTGILTFSFSTRAETWEGDTGECVYTLQQVCLRFSPEQEDKRCCIHLSLTHGTIEVFFASWRKCTRASLSAALPNQRNTQDGRRFLDDSNHDHEPYYFRQKSQLSREQYAFFRAKQAPLHWIMHDQPVKRRSSASSLHHRQRH
jgi:hypothetical protein